jgi:hypothetical protein
MSFSTRSRYDPGWFFLDEVEQASCGRAYKRCQVRLDGQKRWICLQRVCAVMA